MLTKLVEKQSSKEYLPAPADIMPGLLRRTTTWSLRRKAAVFCIVATHHQLVGESNPTAAPGLPEREQDEAAVPVHKRAQAQSTPASPRLTLPVTEVPVQDCSME